MMVASHKLIPLYSLMATLSYSFSLVKFCLSSPIFLILFSCSLNKCHALETKKLDTPHYHTLEISSLLPASVCGPSTTKGPNNRPSTLEVFHKHGPCSQLGQDKATTTPTLSELLSYDQSRVESIQARVNSNSKKKNVNDKKVSLPAQSGRSLGSGNYIVTIGLGTPKKTLSLIFDTGSDVTWTQCEPCARSCYQQQDPIFNPSLSSSYSNVSCSSPQCSELSAATGKRPGCSSSTCVYGIEYDDQSFSVGFFSREKLTLSANDVSPNFLFGCGQNNQGLFGNTAGVLGLGRNPLSIVSQTGQQYGRYFSYCLPSTSSSTGYLTLGRSGVSTSVEFTPFATSQGSRFYFIDILLIAIGGRQLPISQSVFYDAGCIIDSGTVITRLPPVAYSIMRAVFRRLMARYPSAPAYSILDTCYDLTGYTVIRIPTISFIFSGNVEVELAPSGILVAISVTRVCLAFAANREADDVAIFGNTQQKTFEVVYDVAGERLGFGPGGCIDTPVSSLKKYIPTIREQSLVDSNILALSDLKAGIWREAELESWDEKLEMGEVVFEDDGSLAKPRTDAITLSEYAEMSDEEETDTSSK